jgi:hypothetical protein
MNVQTSGLVDRLRASFPTVDKFPLAGPDGMKTPWYGLFRTDTGETVGPGSVSAGYTPHTTDDVVALVEAAEEALGEVTDFKAGFRGGHFVTAEPALSRENRLTLYQNDTVFPRLNISGMYGQGFRASIGLFRIICSNLYTMKRVAGVSVNFRHTSGLRPKMDELIQTFGTLRSGWDSLSAHVRQMDEQRVNVAQFLDAMYGQPDEGSQRSLTIHKNRTEAIITRLARERVAAGREMGSLHEASAWEVFNLIQGYTQHEKPRKGRVGEFDRAIIASLDPVVDRAERLLMSMAV